MIPAGETFYHLATTPQELERCRTLMTEAGQSGEIGFPTVMAERNGCLLGFLSTHSGLPAVVAGPLVTLSNGHHLGIVTMRLIEAYEIVLRRAGMTRYFFSVQEGVETDPWRTILRKLGLRPYVKDAGYYWYERRLR